MWYIPLQRPMARMVRRGVRVCSAGYPRLEKFFISVNSASAQA